jgi:ribonuclease HII
MVGPEEIDRINILRATHLAMGRALEALSKKPDIALIDGLPVKGLSMPHEALVKGDGLSLSIAAASVIAKVTRDRFMERIDQEFPEYGFARHQGYGTRAHLEALRTHGPCRHHRRSFQPVSQLSLPLGDGD